MIEVELDCSQTGWALEPGDCLGVRCANDPEDVEDLLALLGVAASGNLTEAVGGGSAADDEVAAARASPAAPTLLC